MFTIDVIRELMKESVRQIHELENIRAMLPSTQCGRRTLCCSMLPEMTLIEALSSIQHVMNLSEDKRKILLKKIIRYFFLNAVDIIKCPFLEDRDCLIYQNRFFGCRAYGLWSKRYYERISEGGREAKLFVREQWKNLGIFLPEAVTNFKVPYCMEVKTVDDKKVSDEMLLNCVGKMEALSGNFADWHQLYGRMYFNDLSFLFASLAFGVNESVRLKFEIVRDIVKEGSMVKLDQTLERITDILAGFRK